jgi:type IV pilus assembly protein PilY1
MKPALQIATSLVALGGLLFQATSQATNLAELPLKASVFAKPNVIFGMDDSGSMDSEVMQYTNDGAFWWNYTTGSGWGVDASHPNQSMRNSVTLHFNGPGDANATWRKLVYLFPNGKGTGRRVYGDAAEDHFAVMPTSQFAFLRWSGAYKAGTEYKDPPSDLSQYPFHNPIYYNPKVDYKPWPDGQLANGAKVSPAPAAPGAAKSHPMNGLGSVYGGGSGSFDLTSALPLSTNENEHFIALPGMKIPAGAKYSECNASRASCGSWKDVGPSDIDAPKARVTRVAMAYFPASYWVKEPCTVNAAESVAAQGCVALPDGSTLKRYEIKPATSFPSGRTYAKELENFANWFQYYRKRKLLLAAAMGETLETLTGMRLGVVTFNSRSDVTFYDVDVPGDRGRLAGIFYEANGSGGTPTRETLKFIGEQFQRKDKAKDGTYNVMQYACQRNNAFIVSDGFANASNVTMPPWDAGKDKNTWGSGAPYHRIFDGSLADIALRFYTNNLRKDLTEGVVPTTELDRNPNPHMNTYGLTMGARGTLYVSETVAPPTSTSAWPDPSATRSPISVDDLWHATINGRGKMYLAITPADTAKSIQAGLDDIKNQEGAQSSVAVSSFNLLTNDGKAYQASYQPSGWVGDLTANPVDRTTGVISKTETWSAAKRLNARDWTKRVIASSNGSKGVGFTDTDVGGTVAAGTGMGSAGLIAYLRGNRAKEGELYRTRTSLMGAVLNAEPFVDQAGGVVYVASGEGMLHAINRETGDEEWAFVPYGVLTTIGKTAERQYAFKTKLDGSPVVGTYGEGRLLVAGMGAAGRSYYAVDVTQPKGLNEGALAAKVKWTFPPPGDAENASFMGYTVGRPIIVKTAAHGHVALVTSGYDNGEKIGDGQGRLWMLNASTGAVIKRFTTTAELAPATEAGLAQIVAYREDDGTARYVYGGDLLGNLWRFDLSTGTTFLLAKLKDAAGNPQPVTTKPVLTQIDDKRVVMVGTGRLLDVSDFGNSKVQTVYAIADTGVAVGDARKSTTSLSLKDSAITGNVEWTTSAGWFLDLPAMQHVNVDPKLVLGNLHVNTNTNGADNCAQSSNHYMISVRAQGKAPDQVIGSTEVLSSAENATSSTYLQAGDKIFEETRLTNGENLTKERKDPSVIPARKNAWRDIVR